jgi:hypothetical protein
MPELKRIENYYFKWSPSGGLMSGIKPNDVEENVEFVNCTFHPNIWGEIVFKNCVFKDCGLDEWAKEQLAADTRNIGNIVIDRRS